jgi:glyoxylate carboligase
LIDEFLALGAEEIAEDAVRSAFAPSLSAEALSADRQRATADRIGAEADHTYRVALVVSDDLKGGWTNRWASEYSHRIEYAAITKRGWLVVMACLFGDTAD